MPPHMSPTGPTGHRPTDLRALLAAVLLLGVLLGMLSSCGTGDLVFPGNIPSTSTPQFTSTPVPTDTPGP